MREFVALGPKCYSYLMMVIMIKKLKEKKKCVIKRRLKFNDCENRLLNIEIIFKSQ